MPRDFSKAYTAGELEQLKVMFRGMPTYTDGQIASNDLTLMCQKMEYHRTAEEMAVFIDYWDKHFGVIIPIEEFISACSVMHNTSQLAKDRAEVFDKDHNGFISADEFAELMESLMIVDARLKKSSFEDCFGG